MGGTSMRQTRRPLRAEGTAMPVRPAPLPKTTISNSFLLRLAMLVLCSGRVGVCACLLVCSAKWSAPSWRSAELKATKSERNFSRYARAHSRLLAFIYLFS